LYGTITPTSANIDMYLYDFGLLLADTPVWRCTAYEWSGSSDDFTWPYGRSGSWGINDQAIVLPGHSIPNCPSECVTDILQKFGIDLLASPVTPSDINDSGFGFMAMPLNASTFLGGGGGTQDIETDVYAAAIAVFYTGTG